jgi:hypothetical protein
MDAEQPGVLVGFGCVVILRVEAEEVRRPHERVGREVAVIIAVKAAQFVVQRQKPVATFLATGLKACGLSSGSKDAMVVGVPAQFLEPL